VSRIEPPGLRPVSEQTIEGVDLQATTPIPMEAAVGYSSVDCAQEAPGEPTLVLKQDRLFLIVDRQGQITPPGRCGLGLFFDDTRILSHYNLRFAGGLPSLLSAQVLRMYQAQIDLAMSDQAFGGNSWDPKNAIHILRELLLDGSLVERVTLTNYLTEPIDFWVELTLGCDFADIFEVRGWRRETRGQFFIPRVDARSLAFSYRGRDGAVLRTEIRFSEAPTEVSSHGAYWRFRLGASARREIEWEILTEMPGTEYSPGPSRPLEERSARLDRVCENWNATCTRWQTDVAAFNTMLGRGIDDLRALHFGANGSAVIAAGIPWYSTVFGRDSIITALQALPLNPSIAVETLRYLAHHQGRREDPFTEEQPGKIMHELRRGEMARSGEIPHVPYFGTVDATPLWLVLLHETWRWTADDLLVRELLPHAERALDWIDRYGDMDGDGLVEYARTSAKGLVNQGWKDSGDGVPFPDGRLPRPPIALVEVQGYVHDAKLRLGALYDALGQHRRAEELRQQGDELRRAILQYFWLEELGTFALALDGDKRPIPTVASNAGHLLWSRVPTAEQASRLAGRLLGPGMFSGWGIRTLSAAHPVFNPMSYHNGSVWPHDNALVALGLGLYGHREQAGRILTGLYEACVHMESSRLPELFCGMERLTGMQPVLYPVSCTPQAWASAAVFMLLQGALGLFPEAPARVLHVRDPVLPDFLRDIMITGLRIGKSQVALQFRRHRDRTLVNLLEIEGAPLQVSIELS
jgi:glycogen debranching enzyme